MILKHRIVGCGILALIGCGMYYNQLQQSKAREAVEAVRTQHYAAYRSVVKVAEQTGSPESLRREPELQRIVESDNRAVLYGKP